MQKKTTEIRADGISLFGEIRTPHLGSSLPTLCICHGIPSGQPPDPTDAGYPGLAEWFSTAGFTTLIFNFRGTGPSGGNFDMLGWTRDLQAAIDWLLTRPEVDSAHIYVMGFSGGAAASVYVAAHDQRIAGLALCACPAEFRGFDTPERKDLSLNHFREIKLIKDRDFPPSAESWRHSFREVTPINWIDRISPRPLLILHGKADELIDVSHARRLYEKAGEPKEAIIVPGAGHKLRLSERAMELAMEWLLRHSS